MPLNPDAVGSTSEPVEASWDSKDALLYAVGVGAGHEELPFTTENTNDVDQQVRRCQISREATVHVDVLGVGVVE